LNIPPEQQRRINDDIEKEKPEQRRGINVMNVNIPKRSKYRIEEKDQQVFFSSYFFSREEIRSMTPAGGIFQ
jgi:hypothetical protein